MMNKRILIGITLVAAIALSFALGRFWGPAAVDSGARSGSAEREILYWVAPMDPNYRREEPGKSPMGMDLVPVYADDVDGQPGVVSIDPTVVANLGVRTGRAELSPLPRTIETVGYVSYDEDTMEHVHTRVDGWIERLEATAVGNRIQAGQLLFELYSPTLVNAQQEFLAALRSGNSALITASEDRLAALGVTGREIGQLRERRQVSDRVQVYADSDGVIAELGVREGMFVTPATDILSIAQIDRVWVLAEVFERQSAWVSKGQEAIVELDYLPGQMWRGVVDYVYPELDPETRTLTVRLRFDNLAESLRPNMFTRVTIRGQATGDVVHVPREAVIRGGALDRVVVAIGDGRFRAQAVEVGIESGDRIEILHGIAANDEIVVSGQFLIDSESNIESALSRMDSESEQPAEDHSGHDMDGSDGMDHSGHDMGADAEMDHSGHDMDGDQ